MSIKSKFTIFLGVIVVLAILSNLLYIFSTASLRGYSTTTNAVGRLRMRTYRLIHLIHAYRLAPPPEQETILKGIKRDREEFIRILKGLTRKDSRLITINDRKGLSLIQEALKIWEEYNLLIDDLLKAPEQEFKTKHALVDRKADLLFETLDSLVRHISDQGEGRIILVHKLLLFFLGLSIIVFVIALIYFIRRVIYPLRRAADFAKRIEKGDMSIRLEPHLRDEIGLLVDALNKMVERVKASQEELEERVIERTQALSALIEISGEISKELKMSRLLPKIVCGAVRLINGDAGSIALLDENRGIITYPYAYNMPEWITSVSVKKGEGLAGWIMERNSPVILDDYPAHPSAVKGFVDAGVKTLAAVPLFRGKRVIGALGVFGISYEKRFSKEDIESLSIIGTEASIAIENSILFHDAFSAKMEWEDTFNAINESIVILDRELNILRGNVAFYKYIGKSKEEVTGRGYVEVMGEIGKPHGDMPAFIALKEKRVCEETVERGDKILHIKAIPILESKEELSGVVVIIHDITKEKQLETRLIQAEKMVSVGELVSGVAHELNNPLTSVIGYSQLLLGTPLSDRVRKNIEKIASEAERASKIVNNLLIFARKKKPEKTYGDINDVIAKVVDLKAYEFRVNNVTVDLDLSNEILRTMVDIHQLQQVIINIISNAEDAILEKGRKDGRIEIKTRLAKHPSDGRDMIEIEISDNGTGIPPEIAKRIFDPFFTTKEVGKGTGLGLPIAYGILKEHGGDIYLQNREGGGATFLLELPVVSDPLTKGYVVKEPTKEVEGIKHILAIDDEDYILELLQDIFKQEGHRVETTTGGDGVLDRFKDGDYDLILLDIKMPGMNGIEIYKYLSSHRPELASRVIFLTGDVVSKNTLTFLKETGRPFLAKPFGIKELKEAASRVLTEGG